MLSAVILTRNEEKNISKCIESLKFCDEIIVVDDNSTDKTTQIAQKLGAKVITRKLDNNFAAQNNFALKQAKGDWILYIDADERVTNELAEEIQQICHPGASAIGSDMQPVAYEIPRKDFFMGKWLSFGETGNVRVTRFVKKGKGEWGRRVHQYLKVNGSIGQLKNPILHYPHKSISEFVKSTNRWSALHSIALEEENKPSSIWKIMLWPPLKFAQNFIARRGIFDGTRGFVHAAMMSMHSFLAWSNLYVKTYK